MIPFECGVHVITKKLRAGHAAIRIRKRLHRVHEHGLVRGDLPHLFICPAVNAELQCVPIQSLLIVPQPKLLFGIVLA